jgi:hypothetical protein
MVFNYDEFRAPLNLPQQNISKGPYVQSIYFDVINPNFMIVTGFDKANDAMPFVASSGDGGLTWTDQSQLVMDNTGLSGFVAAATHRDELALDPDGAPLMLLAKPAADGAMSFAIVRLRVGQNGER